MSNEQLIAECNDTNFPLRTFINRSHRIWRLGEALRLFRAVLEAEFRREPGFFDVSSVYRPADRVAFVTQEVMGGVVSNVHALDRIDIPG